MRDPIMVLGLFAAAFNKSLAVQPVTITVNEVDYQVNELREDKFYVTTLNAQREPVPGGTTQFDVTDQLISLVLDQWTGETTAQQHDQTQAARSAGGGGAP